MSNFIRVGLWILPEFESPVVCITSRAESARCRKFPQGALCGARLRRGFAFRLQSPIPFRNRRFRGFLVPLRRSASVAVLRVRRPPWRVSGASTRLYASRFGYREDFALWRVLLRTSRPASSGVRQEFCPCRLYSVALWTKRVGRQRRPLPTDLPRTRMAKLRESRCAATPQEIR